MSKKDDLLTRLRSASVERSEDTEVRRPDGEAWVLLHVPIGLAGGAKRTRLASIEVFPTHFAALAAAREDARGTHPDWHVVVVPLPATYSASSAIQGGQ